MKVELVKVKGTWRDIANRCNTTVGKEIKVKEPSLSWKKQILLAEHSPIRTMIFTIRMIDIPYYVSVHLVRHKIGAEHFVKSQRTDRTGIDRTKLTHDSLVTHEMELNIQTLITISRKRICYKADVETRKLWKEVYLCIEHYDDIIASVLVPECVYRGFCPEFNSCGFCNSDNFLIKRINYKQCVAFI